MHFLLWARKGVFHERYHASSTPLYERLRFYKLRFGIFKYSFVSEHNSTPLGVPHSQKLAIHRIASCAKCLFLRQKKSFLSRGHFLFQFLILKCSEMHLLCFG